MGSAQIKTRRDNDVFTSRFSIEERSNKISIENTPLFNSFPVPSKFQKTSPNDLFSSIGRKRQDRTQNYWNILNVTSK